MTPERETAFDAMLAEAYVIMETTPPECDDLEWVLGGLIDRGLLILPVDAVTP